MARIKNYHIIGNASGTAWVPTDDPSQEMQDQIDFFISRFDMCQIFTGGWGRVLVDNGMDNVLKYRLGSGSFVNITPGSERIIIRDRLSGTEPAPYNVDRRMPSTLGGVMTSDDPIYYANAIDHTTEVGDILIDSLTPHLTGGSDNLQGVFLDVAGPYNPASFAAPEQHIPDQADYNADFDDGRLADHDAWRDVYIAIQAAFPGDKLLLNNHRPWEDRTPGEELTGLRLVQDAGIFGMMSENRMLFQGGISAWTNESILDIEETIAAGKACVVVYHYQDTPENTKIRNWALANFLVATGGSTLGFLAIDGVDETLPIDYPEHTFDLDNLGAVVGGISVEGDGQVFKRTFANGLVFVHGERLGDDKTINIPAGYERASVSGGGLFGSGGGTITWTPLPGGPYTLKALGTNVDHEDSSFILRQVAVPSIDGFTTSKEIAEVDETFTLSWSTTGADSVTASGDWSGPKADDDSEIRSESAEGAYTYTLTVTNPSGSDEASVEVEVGLIHRYTLQHDGEEREYYVRNPTNKSSAPKAVVIGLHGGLGSALQFREDYEFEPVADANDFIMVYPEGLMGILGRTWNAAGCCGQAVDDNNDDSGFLAAMIDDLPNRANVDLSRIYICGMSNGGMMAQRMAVRYPDKIAAAAGVAGGITTTDELPEWPVPMLHVHGVLDPSYDGGPGVLDPFDQLDVENEIIPFWLQQNGSHESPILDTMLAYQTRTYEGSFPNAPVKLIKMFFVGHSWPTETPINTAQEIWDFVSQHQLKPGASITASPRWTTTPATITVTGAGSRTDQPYEYSADLGDGSFTAWQDSPTFTIEATEAGELGLRMKVRTKTTQVEAETIPSFFVHLTAGEVTGEAPLTVNFSGTRNVVGEEFEFDFGEGPTTGFTPQATASHVYTNPGTYTARLRLRSLNVESNWASVEVGVVPPEPYFQTESAWTRPGVDPGMVKPADGDAFLTNLGEQGFFATRNPALELPGDWSVPIFFAPPGTATVPVKELDGIATLDNVPMPADAIPAGNEAALAAFPAYARDGHMVIVETDAQGNGTFAWDFFRGVRFVHTDDSVRAEVLRKWDLTGDGVDPTGDFCRAAGVPLLHGLIRASEIKKGVINHRLAMVVPRPDAVTPSWGFGVTDGYPPCNRAGGELRGAYGTLVFLNRDYPLDGLTRSQRIVAQALKVYGAYFVENTTENNPPVFYVESVDDKPDVSIPDDLTSMFIPASEFTVWGL